MLSVIIITKNAAEHLERCLCSISWVDEIIVLDSGSTDKTVEICQQFPVKIYHNADWQGFGVQKNRALQYATGDWVLSLDADEEVTPELRQALQHSMLQTEYSAFAINRLSRYCGRWIWHGGWHPDYVVRLFKRGCAQFSTDLVHEQLQVIEGKTGKIKQMLLHYSFNSVEEVLHKINHYSTAGAQMRWAQGKRGSLRRAILHGSWMFLRTYILRAGFLDGRQGFMLAVSNAEGTYYRYLKLLYLEENQKEKENS